MKIAQIAPLMESIPPRLYGGTERVASYLTEELVAQGHDVTLFASGQSITSAKLVPGCAQPLRLNPAVRDIIPYYMLMLDKVRSMAAEFDILHFHIDQFHFPLFRDVGVTHRHDAARPAGPARPAPSLSRLSRDAAGFDLQCAAGADSRRQLHRHRLSWSADRSVAQPRAARRLSGVPRAHLAGEACRPRDRHRPGHRLAAEDRGESRSRRRGLLPRGDRAAAGPARRRVTSARSTTAARMPSSATLVRCSSRSTGPSRSGWR